MDFTYRSHIFFVDQATGEVHQNRPDLAGGLLTKPADPLPGDDYPLAGVDTLLRTDNDGWADDENALEFAGEGGSPIPLVSCGSRPFPGCYGGSGAYRRIFTPPLPAERVCPNGPLPGACAGANYSNSGYFNTGVVTTFCNAGNMVPNSEGKLPEPESAAGRSPLLRR